MSDLKTDIVTMELPDICWQFARSRKIANLALLLSLDIAHKIKTALPETNPFDVDIPNPLQVMEKIKSHMLERKVINEPADGVMCNPIIYEIGNVAWYKHSYVTKESVNGTYELVTNFWKMSDLFWPDATNRITQYRKYLKTNMNLMSNPCVRNLIIDLIETVRDISRLSPEGSFNIIMRGQATYESIIANPELVLWVVM